MIQTPGPCRSGPRPGHRRLPARSSIRKTPASRSWPTRPVRSTPSRRSGSSRLLHATALLVGHIRDWLDLAIDRGVMLDVAAGDHGDVLVRPLIGSQKWKVNHLELYADRPLASRPRSRLAGRVLSPWTRSGNADADRRVLNMSRSSRTRTASATSTAGSGTSCTRRSPWIPTGTKMMGMRGREYDPAAATPGFIGSVYSLCIFLIFLGPRVRPPRLGRTVELRPTVSTTIDWSGQLVLPSHLGREVLVWGDILAGHPDRLDEVPDGITVREWAYDAGHPWDARLAARLTPTPPGGLPHVELVHDSPGGPPTCGRTSAALAAGTATYRAAETPTG